MRSRVTMRSMKLICQQGQQVGAAVRPVAHLSWLPGEHTAREDARCGPPPQVCPPKHTKHHNGHHSRDAALPQGQITCQLLLFYRHPEDVCCFRKPSRLHRAKRRPMNKIDHTLFYPSPHACLPLVLWAKQQTSPAALWAGQPARHPTPKGCLHIEGHALYRHSRINLHSVTLWLCPPTISFLWSGPQWCRWRAGEAHCVGQER